MEISAEESDLVFYIPSSNSLFDFKAIFAF
jgi:hypothetical protein